MADEPTTTWYEGLDADTKAHVTGKGWEKLDPPAAAAEASKAHFAAQKMIGVPAEQLLKLPKDAADPTYADVYNRVVGMGTPKTAEEYKFDGIKFKDGTDIDATDVSFVRDLAFKYKLPANIARGIAVDMAARADGMADQETTSNSTTVAANDVALRRAWNTDHDLKSFAVRKVADAAGLPASLMASIKNLPEADFVQTMNALAGMGAQMNEAAMLRGGITPRDPTASMTQEEAGRRLTALRGGNDPVWGQKITAGDREANEELQKIIRISIGAPRQ